MSTPERGRRGWFARALALSWFAVVLAGAAHLVAGGTAPGVAATLLVGAFLTVVGMPLCGTAFRLTVHGPLLLVQQLATHVVLSLTSPRHGAPVRPTAQLAAAIDNGHAIHSSALHLQHAGSMPGAMTGHSLIPTPAMALAHVVAAAAVVALLSAAESGHRALRALSLGRTWLTTRLCALINAMTSTPVLCDVAALLRCRPTREQWAPAAPLALGDLWRSPAPCRRGPPRPSAA